MPCTLPVVLGGHLVKATVYIMVPVTIQRLVVIYYLLALGFSNTQRGLPIDTLQVPVDLR